jgi:hypothetical protein
MSNKTISQLPEIKTEDVHPMYTYDEALNALARAVHFMRESNKTTYQVDNRQALMLELMYSLALKK